MALAVAALVARPGTAEAKTCFLDEDTKEVIHTVRDEYAERYGFKIDLDLLYAMAMVESSGNPKAVSDMGCIGLYQINPELHAWRYEAMGFEGNPDWYDAETSTWVCLNYIDELRQDYGYQYEEDGVVIIQDADIALVLALYNGDSKVLKDDFYISPYAEKILQIAAKITAEEESKG